MTREDAFEIWLPIIKMGVKSMPECSEALDMAIKALKQEPCADAISRQAAIDGADAIIARDTSGNNDVVKAMTAWKSYVEGLPSVTAEKQEPCENIGNIYECSCGYGWDKNKVVRHHFCPNCGRKVQEVKE